MNHPQNYVGSKQHERDYRQGKAVGIPSFKSKALAKKSSHVAGKSSREEKHFRKHFFN